MITHEHVWRALDHVAACKRLSISALARVAGLDATTFNASKRLASGSGKERWLSTQSLVKVLNITDISMSRFGTLVDAAGDTGSDALAPDPAAAAAHYRESAERVRSEAQSAREKLLKEVLADIARRYEMLALWLEGKASNGGTEQR